MISFEDLKENALIIIDSIDIDSVHFSQKFSTLNCLILIKKIETDSITQQTWLCFCNGKICRFVILKGDFIHLTIIK